MRNDSGLPLDSKVALYPPVFQDNSIDYRPGGGRIVCRRNVVESDRHFYMRRVVAERLAAARAVTEEGRQRRLVLVETYLQKLQAMPA
ncbi:hypothetical protein [Sphingomonas sp. UYP23]